MDQDLRGHASQDLGRAGTVCPFVPGSLERKTLWLAPEQIADREVPEVVELMSGYKRPCAESASVGRRDPRSGMLRSGDRGCSLLILREDRRVTDSGQEEPPSHYLDPAKLTDEELERELTLNFEGGDPERLDYYERLLRERAKRRAR